MAPRSSPSKESIFGSQREPINIDDSSDDELTPVADLLEGRASRSPVKPAGNGEGPSRMPNASQRSTRSRDVASQRRKRQRSSQSSPQKTQCIDLTLSSDEERPPKRVPFNARAGPSSQPYRPKDRGIVVPPPSSQHQDDSASAPGTWGNPQFMSQGILPGGSVKKKRKLRLTSEEPDNSAAEGSQQPQAGPSSGSRAKDEHVRSASVEAEVVIRRKDKGKGKIGELVSTRSPSEAGHRGGSRQLSGTRSPAPAESSTLLSRSDLLDAMLAGDPPQDPPDMPADMADPAESMMQQDVDIAPLPSGLPDMGSSRRTTPAPSLPRASQPLSTPKRVESDAPTDVPGSWMCPIKMSPAISGPSSARKAKSRRTLSPVDATPMPSPKVKRVGPTWVTTSEKSSPPPPPPRVLAPEVALPIPVEVPLTAKLPADATSDHMVGAEACDAERSRQFSPVSDFFAAFDQQPHDDAPREASAVPNPVSLVEQAAAAEVTLVPSSHIPESPLFPDSEDEDLDDLASNEGEQAEVEPAAEATTNANEVAEQMEIDEDPEPAEAVSVGLDRQDTESTQNNQIVREDGQSGSAKIKGVPVENNEARPMQSEEGLAMPVDRQSDNLFIAQPIQPLVIVPSKEATSAIDEQEAQAAASNIAPPDSAVEDAAEVDDSLGLAAEAVEETELVVKPRAPSTAPSIQSLTQEEVTKTFSSPLPEFRPLRPAGMTTQEYLRRQVRAGRERASARSSTPPTPTAPTFAGARQPSGLQHQIDAQEPGETSPPPSPSVSALAPRLQAMKDSMTTMDRSAWRRIVEDEGVSDASLLVDTDDESHPSSGPSTNLDMQLSSSRLDDPTQQPPPERRGVAQREFNSATIDEFNARKPFLTKNPPLHRLVFEGIIAEKELEAGPVSVVNDVDGQGAPPDFEFEYSNEMLYHPDVPDPEKGLGCGCEGPCDPRSKTCTCLKRQQAYFYNLGIEGFAYNRDGLAKALSCPIWECSETCGCPPECINRVIQKGRKRSTALEIFKTKQKGWGVRAKMSIPEGTFIGVYAGEVITEEESEQRGELYSEIGRTYLFDLDGWQISNVPAGLAEIDPRLSEIAEASAARAKRYSLGDDLPGLYNAFSVDAFHYGNYTRYFNHSCDPNLEITQCYVKDFHPERPLLCIFARRDIKSREELCISYKGIPDDMPVDERSPVKPSGKKGKGRQSKTSATAHISTKAKKNSKESQNDCYCRAPNCDGKMFNMEE